MKYNVFHSTFTNVFFNSCHVFLRFLTVFILISTLFYIYGLLCLMGNPPLTAVILVGLQKCHAAWQQKTTGPHGVN